MPRQRAAAADEVIKLGLYARISQANDQLGVDRQIRDLRRRIGSESTWLRGREFQIVDVYVDNDISAYDASLTRPAFERLKDDFKTGRVTAVAAWNFDRLWRLGLDFHLLLDIMRRANSYAMLALEGDPRLIDIVTNEGVQMAQIKSAMAEGEVHSTTTRVLFKHAELAEFGRSSGGIRRFGYTADHMQVVPEEAAIIKDCATRLLAGESLTSLARDLNERGIPTVGAGHWQASSLKHRIAAEPREDDDEAIVMVRQLVAAGQKLKHIVISLNRAQVPPPGHTKWKATTIGRILTGRHLIGKRCHQGQEYEAQWPAILTVEEHNAIAALLSDPRRRVNGGRGGRAKYPFAGLLQCGRCGKTLYTRWVQNARLWTCVTVVGGCGRIARRAQPMEEWILRDMLTLLDDPATASALLSLQDSAGERTSLTQEIEHVGRLKAELEIAYWDVQPGEPRMEKGTYDMLKLRHDDRLATAWARLNQLNVDPVLAEELRAGDFATRWESMPLHRQQVVLRGLAAGIVVKPLGRGRSARSPQECYEVRYRI